jgi:hypothetical protein
VAYTTPEALAYLAAINTFNAARQTAVAAVQAERAGAGVTDSTPGYTPGPKETELATLGIQVEFGHDLPT